ncbi:MAG: hypothetical protein ACJ764_13275 [Solirubrobacteraceae bacterium]
MKKRVARMVGKPTVKRIAGFDVGLIQAQAAAAVVGLAAGVATYRLLRAGD